MILPGPRSGLFSRRAAAAMYAQALTDIRTFCRFSQVS